MNQNDLINILKSLIPGNEDNFSNPNHEGFFKNICCPFPHGQDINGNPTYETNPSVSIKATDDDFLFYCHSEQRSYQSIQDLVKNLRNMSNIDAYKYCDTFAKEGIRENIVPLQGDPLMQIVSNFKFSSQALSTAKVTIGREGIFSVPVYYNGILLDIRTYFGPSSSPKWTSLKNTTTGLIVNYDNWKNNKNKPTIICAGEKDLLMALSHGLNAISITGGEGKIPTLYSNDFKDREVCIIYDNDDVGKKSGIKLANWIFEQGAKSVKNITGHHYICKEKGEDLYDFFTKYGKNAYDLEQIFNNTPTYSKESVQKSYEKKYKVLDFDKALEPEHRNKLYRSTIQIFSTFEESYNIPKQIMVSCYEEHEDNKLLKKGERLFYEITEANCHKLLQFINVDKTVLRKAINMMVFNTVKPVLGVRITYIENITVYPANISPFKSHQVLKNEENTTASTNNFCYVCGERVVNGHIYNILYKTTVHPKTQANVPIIWKAENIGTGFKNFTLTEDVKNSIMKFNSKWAQFNFDLNQYWNWLIRNAKSFTTPYSDENIFYAYELLFHSPLWHKWLVPKKERAVLFGMIVGETRTGKSAVGESMINHYEVGTFVNAKTSTTAGLVGGSVQIKGTWKITLGSLPKNHERLVIIEEAHGGPSEFRKTLTDAKSRGVIKIIRSGQEMATPINLRLMEVANQKGDRPLKNYPHGIQVIKEIVNANEDIARYDFFVLVGETRDNISLDSWKKDALHDLEQIDYLNRLKWAWSRKTENIKMTKEVDSYLWEESQKMAKKYESHIKIFGTETHQKIRRISIALATLSCSTDNKFEDVIVNKCHVQWVCNWLENLYNNPIFKLVEYVEEERSYNNLDRASTLKLQQILPGHEGFFDYIVTCTEISRNDLQAISGKGLQDFVTFTNMLTTHRFIRTNARSMLEPTYKLKQTYLQVKNSNLRLKEPGEYEGGGLL